MTITTTATTTTTTQVPINKKLSADLPLDGCDIDIIPRLMQVRTEIRKKNDILARQLRDQWTANGTLVVSLVSSPGAGKTEFLKNTLSALANDEQGYKVAALVGDLATENDANRLAESGVPVKQIVTGTFCHLEADMVEKSLLALSEDKDLKVGELDILFIENVGNMVCPSTYDLGEDQRAVLVSTTEGEDKPLKYPTIFNTADVAVVSKMDLAEILGYDRQQMLDSIQSVRPGMPTFEVAARESLANPGFAEWIDYLKAALVTKRNTELPSWEILEEQP